MDVTWILCAFLVLVINNYASASHAMENKGMFEGDIAGIDPYGLMSRNAIVNEDRLWPKGVVYFEIDWDLRQVVHILIEALAEYQTKTCLEFRPKTASTKDYVKFIHGHGCWSPVGRYGGVQVISLGFECQDKISVLHEIGHAIGLWHEHSRSDRDDYLEIIWDNIKPDMKENFFKLEPWENNLLGEEFDYKSIMLYEEYAFSKDRKSMTMKPKKEGVVIGPMNKKPGLSDSDVRRINKLYECFGATRPPPPDVPDIKCDFEKDMCDLTTEKHNSLAEWEINKGELGGRTGSYLTVKAKDAGFQNVRLVTRFFKAYGHKNGCLRFDIYFNGEGFASLDIMMYSTETSKLMLKHVEKKNTWQTINIDIELEGDTYFSLDAKTQTKTGDGLIAIDNFVYGLRSCHSL